MSWNYMTGLGSVTGTHLDSANKHIMTCKVDTLLLANWLTNPEADTVTVMHSNDEVVHAQGQDCAEHVQELPGHLYQSVPEGHHDSQGHEGQSSDISEVNLLQEQHVRLSQAAQFENIAVHRSG